MHSCVYGHGVKRGVLSRFLSFDDSAALPLFASMPVGRRYPPPRASCVAHRPVHPPPPSNCCVVALPKRKQYVPCDVSTVCFGTAASMGAFLLGAGAKVSLQISVKRDAHKYITALLFFRKRPVDCWFVSLLVPTASLGFGRGLRRVCQVPGRDASQVVGVFACVWCFCRSFPHAVHTFTSTCSR